MQKKLEIRYNALVMGLRLVIIMIADATPTAEKISINIFSNVNCKTVSG